MHRSFCSFVLDRYSSQVKNNSLTSDEISQFSKFMWKKSLFKKKKRKRKRTGKGEVHENTYLSLKESNDISYVDYYS